MLILRRLPILIALVAGGLAFMALALTASAAPAAPSVARPYPDPLNQAPCNTTLQACINGSNPGDQITIAAGTYVTSVTLNKAVSLAGAAINATVLRAPAGQRVLTVTSAVTPGTTISNLTLQGGVLASGNGGAVLVQAGAQPALQSLVIQSGTVTATNAFGGGLYTEASLVITSVHFLNNTAFRGFGGGLASGPGAHLTLVSVNFTGNSANESGGGVFANSHLTVTGGLLRGNRSVIRSGGAMIVGGNLLLSGSVITGSRSHDSGGALFITGTTSLISAVISDSLTTGGSGAGLRAVGAAHISGTQFLSNTAYNPGGGVRASTSVFITNTAFISNTAGAGGTGEGGGVRANAAAEIYGGSFVANSASKGGGAYVGGTLTLTGTLFKANTAATEGGGLRVFTGTVQSAVFEQNRVTAGNGGGLHAANTLTLSRTIFQGNAVLSGTSTFTLSTGNGGGVFGDGLVSSTDNVFLHNHAHRLGGGMDADDLNSTWDQFRGNTTGPQGSGGGLFVAGVLDLDGGLFYTNTANTAGGLGVNTTGSGTIANSLFARNVVTFSDGGAAMRLLSLTSVDLYHNTLAGTNAPNRAAVIMPNPQGHFSFFANLITHHVRGLQHGGAPPTSTVSSERTVFYSVTLPYLGAVGAASDLTGTIHYRDPNAGDFRLLPGSAALDYAPSYGLGTDFEGQPRPMGSGFDVGYDEALPARVYVPVVVR